MLVFKQSEHLCSPVLHVRTLPLTYRTLDAFYRTRPASDGTHQTSAKFTVIDFAASRNATAELDVGETGAVGVHPSPIFERREASSETSSRIVADGNVAIVLFKTLCS